jgi:hypothetical protein
MLHGDGYVDTNIRKLHIKNTKQINREHMQIILFLHGGIYPFGEGPIW